VQVGGGLLKIAVGIGKQRRLLGMWHPQAAIESMPRTAQGSVPPTKTQQLTSCAVLCAPRSAPLASRRICLEEDSLAALEQPCGCAGTQRFAHKDCIQKWVNEKHHTTCEICDQPYKGKAWAPACSHRR
jgi:hypothetical protein